MCNVLFTLIVLFCYYLSPEVTGKPYFGRYLPNEWENGVYMTCLLFDSKFPVFICDCGRSS